MLMSYSAQKKAVKEVVNEIDPIGLIRGGAPLDEYDAEVTQIVVILQRYKDKDVDAVVDRIHLVFKRNFGAHLVGAKSEYIRMTKMLIERIRRYE